MSMAPYLPPSSGEVGIILGLLQAIGDPASAKKVLEKLVAEQAKLEKLVEEHTRLVDEQKSINKNNSDQLQNMNVIKQALDQRKFSLDQKEKELIARDADFAVRERKTRELEQQIQTKIEGLSVFKNAHQMKERELKEATDLLDARGKALEKSILQHERWLASIKPPGDG